MKVYNFASMPNKYAIKSHQYRYIEIYLPIFQTLVVGESISLEILFSYYLAAN